MIPLPMVDAAGLDGGDLFTGFMTVLAAAGGGTAFWQYWKDRKKSNADGTVATATIELQIDNAKMNSLEHRFALAERAWDSERQSWQGRVDRLIYERDELQIRLTDKETLIFTLQERVSELGEEVLAVSRELSDALRTSRGESEPDQQ